MTAPDLTFATVDDWAFCAAARTAIAVPAATAIPHIGALIELARLARQYPPLVDQLSAIIDGHPLAALVATGELNRLIELGGGTGFVQLAVGPLPDTERTRLSIRAKSAAVSAGFGSRNAGQLTAAMLEMLDNIIEHSGASHTGLIAYQAGSRQFSFVVADSGIGALASLHTNPKFAGLTSDRDALPLVLQDGCSRHVDAGRGKGFNDLFRGLADHNGQLRFRSGAAAVLIDGHSPQPLHPKVKAKPPLQGFFAAVTCSL